MISTSSRSPERLGTGSEAFDRILGGGLPARSITVVAGEPGAGKTLFALQMLFHLALQGKKGLYFTTLSEPALKLIGHLQQFGFFDEHLIDRRIVFADLGSVIREKGPEATLAAITERVEREDASLVVIDSFKAIDDLVGQPAPNRAFVYDLAVHAAAWGTTTLLLGEFGSEDIANHPSFAIADGIIRFANQPHGLTRVRVVEVLKLRGTDFITGQHFFEINSVGLSFFPRVRGTDREQDPPAQADARASTGITGLDEILGGGLPRTSSTLVQGGTGTGKTLLALQFLVEGARRGESGIHFALEETAGHLREIARLFAWDLPELERRRALLIRYVSPVELSTDRFLDQARQQAEQLGARRAVIDSLTSMELGVPSARRFKELVYAITKHFRAAGVTLLMNMEVPELLGSAHLSGYGVSFAADNVIQLRYVEIEGRLERGLVVLKARGVRHATDVRRLVIGTTGVQVGLPYDGFRGVLTGMPTPTARNGP
jgi:circadian clock protein KaiC